MKICLLLRVSAARNQFMKLTFTFHVSRAWLLYSIAKWETGLSQYVAQTRDSQIFQKSRNHLKILGSKRVTGSKFHTQDPQILVATLQSYLSRRPGQLVRPWHGPRLQSTAKETAFLIIWKTKSFYIVLRSYITENNIFISPDIYAF